MPLNGNGNLEVPQRFGVLGWPVSHSRSPAIHAAAYRELGLEGFAYQLLPVPPELFADTVRALPAVGFRGANVTIPHKEAALRLADTASAAATAIGAANTLVFTADGIAADNTDAPGLLAALPCSVAGRKAVVLGAGGSARAVVWALLNAGASEVGVWNRTAVRAAQLCEEVGGYPVEQVDEGDLLINCTSVGLSKPEETFDLLPVTPKTLAGFDCVVDLVYTEQQLPLIATAQKAGIKTVDGLKILVHQAALSFELWTGLTAPLAAMERAVGR